MKRHLAAYDGLQEPSFVILAGLQSDELFRRLFEEDSNLLVVAGDGPDQFEWGTLRRLRLDRFDTRHDGRAHNGWRRR